MTLHLYVACFAIALIGMALHMALKMKSLQDKARAANVVFKARQYFHDDWLSILGSLLTIFMFLLFIDNVLKWKPALIDFVKIFFAFVGYTGSDIASRLFGVLNTKINSVIDQKANALDGTNTATTKV
jgi:hypothetical protein